MGNYKLLREAESDYREIGRYTQQTWGVEQRQSYFNSLLATFERLANNPELGRERTDIRPNLRSYAHRQHIIFYRVTPDAVEILRILHQARDVHRVF